MASCPDPSPTYHLARSTVLLLVLLSRSFAQCELQELTASDASGGAEDFGFAISVSDHVAIIGAQADDDASPGDPSCTSGSAYVFRQIGTTWIEEQKLTASDAACGDHFGSSVSISSVSDVVAVGAWGKAQGPYANSGAVYIFRWNGFNWVQEQKLTAPNPQPQDYFGESVSVEGDLAVVGAPNLDGHGAAFVFRFDGNDWIPEAKLSAHDGEWGDGFGASISVSGDVILVGAYLDGTGGVSEHGSAYIYYWLDGVGWIEGPKLTASDGSAGDRFGQSVSIGADGAVAVIGAPWDDDGCEGDCQSGSAYVFRFVQLIGWIQEAKLVASDAAQNDQFGTSVLIEDPVALVGAYFDDCASGSRCGAAYVYLHNENRTTSDHTDGLWEETDKLVASDPEQNNYFGHSVALAGTQAMVGADGDDDACPGDPACNSGKVYVYSLRPCPIPTVTAWGLAAMTLLVLSAGTVVLRIRRVIHT